MGAGSCVHLLKPDGKPFIHIFMHQKYAYLLEEDNTGLLAPLYMGCAE